MELKLQSVCNDDDDDDAEIVERSVDYRPGRFGLANPRWGPLFWDGWTSSCNRSPDTSSAEDASIYKASPLISDSL